MGFFEIPPPEPDDLDSAAEDEVTEPRWLGGVVPVEELIGSSDRAAIGVRCLVAYRDGFSLSLVAWLRRRPPRALRQLGGGHIQLNPHRFGIREADGSVNPGFVRFGIQFPDGGRATNFDSLQRRRYASEQAHGMEARGGSGSGTEADQDYWVWPVPRGGDLVLVCEWPAYGIAESRLTVGGDQLRAAAARARLIWPDDAGGNALWPSGSSERVRHYGAGRIAGLRAARAAGPAPGGAAGAAPGGAAGQAPGGAAGSAPTSDGPGSAPEAGPQQS